MSVQSVERERRVTPLELFFDLVFAFGFTQVTTVLSDDPTWAGLAHGMLVLTALWWAWASYAWLTNLFDAGEGAMGAALLVAMGAMFVAALAVPEVFGRHGVVFGVAFLIVGLMFLALNWLEARDEPDLLGAVARIAPWPLVGSGLIIVAGFVDDPLRSVIWLVALVVGFLGPLVTGVEGWRVQPAHFVERHGLIVIIAIGESLIAIGVGARRTELGAGVILAAVLGLATVASFWLAYFDFFTLRAQQMLSDRAGVQRTALARDVFTYLHLPMIAGIILFAFGLKTTIAHVGDELGTIPALGLCGGSALYLLGYVALRVRVSRTLGRGRPAAMLACAALFPAARVVPALAALALLTGVWVALHAYEIIRYREARATARALRTSAA